MSSEILSKEKQDTLGNYPMDLEDNEIAIPYFDGDIIRYEKRILLGDA